MVDMGAAKVVQLSAPAAMFADPSLEQRVLATLARDEEMFWRFTEDYLVPETFSIPENRNYFLALSEAYAAGRPVPEPPAAEPLTGDELEAAVMRLADLAQRRVAAEVVGRFWADLGSGAAVQDALVRAIEELGRAQELVKLLAPGQGIPATQLLVSLEKEYQEAHTLMATTGRPSPHPSFGPELKSLTGLTGGLQPGVWIIGGQPGAGKTFFCLNLAVRYLEAERDTACLWIDVDEVRPPTRWAMWFSCVAARACVMRFERYHAPVSELRQVLQAAAPVAARAEFFEASESTLVAHLRGAVRRLRARTGAKRCLVVVDHLQKLALRRAGGTARDYRERVDAVLLGLTGLVKVAEGPVIIISTLTKESWKTDDASVADFRESGTIGHEADVAVILRPTDDKRNKDPNSGVFVVELTVVKNRLGGTGSLTLYGDKLTGRFRETDPGKDYLLPPELRRQGQSEDTEIPF